MIHYLGCALALEFKVPGLRPRSKRTSHARQGPPTTARARASPRAPGDRLMVGTHLCSQALGWSAPRRRCSRWEAWAGWESSRLLAVGWTDWSEFSANLWETGRQGGMRTGGTLPLVFPPRTDIRSVNKEQEARSHRHCRCHNERPNESDLSLNCPCPTHIINTRNFMNRSNRKDRTATQSPAQRWSN